MAEGAGSLDILHAHGLTTDGIVGDGQDHERHVARILLQHLLQFLQRDVTLEGRMFKNRIKIWYKKWCYIGVSKLLIFNTLIYKIVRCKFA